MKEITMTKPLKIYAAKPLNTYLATTPVKVDMVKLMNERQDAFFTGVEMSLTEMKRREQKPVSNSQSVNRLAERYLWLRREYFPRISYAAWTTILNYFNGRSEVDMDEITNFINQVKNTCSIGDLEVTVNLDSITDIGFGPRDTIDSIALSELVSLERVNLNIIREFSEWYWGQERGTKLDNSTFQNLLSRFSGIYEGFCLTDDDNDYVLSKHWSMEKVPLSNLEAMDSRIEVIWSVSHKSGFAARCIQFKNDERTLTDHLLDNELSSYEKNRLLNELFQFIDTKLKNRP